MDINDVYEVRRANLARLIRARFDGNQAALAVRIDRGAAQVSQWLKGHRNISDATRDLIESMCNAQGWLDQPLGVLTAAEPPPACLPTLDQALEVLGIQLARVPADLREALAINLAGWARAGGIEPWHGLVLGLLRPAASTGNRHAA